MGKDRTDDVHIGGKGRVTLKKESVFQRRSESVTDVLLAMRERERGGSDCKLGSQKRGRGWHAD